MFDPRIGRNKVETQEQDCIEYKLISVIIVDADIF